MSYDCSNNIFYPTLVIFGYPLKIISDKRHFYVYDFGKNHLDILEKDVSSNYLFFNSKVYFCRNLKFYVSEIHLIRWSGRKWNVKMQELLLQPNVTTTAKLYETFP